MAQTIEFNTGRKYTAEGQVIKATLHDDGEVTFMDLSRGIDGHVGDRSECRAYSVSEFNQKMVMEWYDKGMYYSSIRSFTDGMQPGGVNTR